MHGTVTFVLEKKIGVGSLEGQSPNTFEEQASKSLTNT